MCIRDREIYRNPANLFVAGFIGSPNMNVWDTELISNNGQHYLTLGNARIPMDKSSLAARGLQGPIKAGILSLIHISITHRPMTGQTITWIPSSEAGNVDVYKRQP